MANVFLVDARVLATGRRHGVHVGYLGSHGCKVSLLVWPHPRDFPLELPTTRRWRHAPSLRVGAYGYVLLADLMPRARFQALAETLYRRTWNAAPLKREDRRRLLAGKSAAPPSHVLKTLAAFIVRRSPPSRKIDC